jgi:hypothetical protein
MSSKTAALIFGVVFIAVGLLGFINNPVIGTAEGAIFHADATHNYVHIASGVLFLLVAMMSRASAGFMMLFGIIYLIIGVLGMVSGDGSVLGFLHVNAADNYLHIALGLVIFLAGVVTRRKVAVA